MGKDKEEDIGSTLTKSRPQEKCLLTSLSPMTKSDRTCFKKGHYAILITVILLSIVFLLNELNFKKSFIVFDVQCAPRSKLNPI